MWHTFNVHNEYEQVSIQFTSQSSHIFGLISFVAGQLLYSVFSNLWVLSNVCVLCPVTDNYFFPINVTMSHGYGPNQFRKHNFIYRIGYENVGRSI